MITTLQSQYCAEARPKHFRHQADHTDPTYHQYTTNMTTHPKHGEQRDSAKMQFKRRQPEPSEIRQQRVNRERDAKDRTEAYFSNVKIPPFPLDKLVASRFLREVEYLVDDHWEMLVAVCIVVMLGFVIGALLRRKG